MLLSLPLVMIFAVISNINPSARGQTRLPIASASTFAATAWVWQLRQRW